MSLDLVGMPKAELHVHLEAATNQVSAVELADRYGKTLPAAGPFRSLTEFVAVYEQARDLIGSLDDLYRLAREFSERQRADGVVWSEVYFIPSTYAGRLGHPDGLIEAVVDGLRSGTGLDQAGLILGVNRGLPISEAFDAVDCAVRWAGRGVVALGLAGDELHYPAGLFGAVFEKARAAGLPAVPHAGEAVGPSSVRETLELLRPARISHGFRAVEDQDLVFRLADERICLDLAPSSNFLLGGVASFEVHPLPTLMRAGIPISINSDSPFFVGHGLLDEYRRCIAAWGLSDGEVVALAENSIRYSFCPEPVRRKALADLAALTQPGQLGPAD